MSVSSQIGDFGSLRAPSDPRTRRNVFVSNAGYPDFRDSNRAQTQLRNQLANHINRAQPMLRRRRTCYMLLISEITDQFEAILQTFGDFIGLMLAIDVLIPAHESEEFAPI